MWENCKLLSLEESVRGQFLGTKIKLIFNYERKQIYMWLVCQNNLIIIFQYLRLYISEPCNYFSLLPMGNYEKFHNCKNISVRWGG